MDKEIINECQYPEYISKFQWGLARIKISNKWGLIDKKGDYFFEPVFDYITHCICKKDNINKKIKGMQYAFKLNGKWGFLNREGTVDCSLDIDRVILNKSTINSEYFVVMKGNVVGIVDGELKASFRWESNDYVEHEGKKIFINIK